jgi:hypothetical protein
MSALLGAAPGFILAMLGFYGLALVQMGRASVDSAEYGQQSLEVARQQLEVSREVLDQGKKTAASYAALVGSNQPRSKKKVKNTESESSEVSYTSKAKSELKTEPPADVPSAHPKLEKPVPVAVKDDPQPALPEPPIEVRLPEPKPEPVAVPLRKQPEPKLETVAEPVRKQPEPMAKPVAMQTSKQPEPPKVALHLNTPDPKPVAPSKKPEPKREPYIPKQIEEKDGVFSYGSTTFSSEAAARRYVAQLGVNPNVKLPDA